jgi:hypothetical protein
MATTIGFIKYLNISRSAFYVKRKKNTFTFEEIEKIISLLDSEDQEEEEDETLLIEELMEMKRIGKRLTSDDLDRMLRK